MALILAVVGEIENSKQTHLSKEERIALAADLDGTGEPIERIRRMAENLKRRETYGKISLDRWLEGEDLMTRAQVSAMIEGAIEFRREEFKRRTPDWTERDLAAAGLASADEYFRSLWFRLLERETERQKAELGLLRKMIAKLSDEEVVGLYLRAVRAGLVADDRLASSKATYARFYLRSNVASIRRELEEIRLRMKSGEEEPAP